MKRLLLFQYLRRSAILRLSKRKRNTMDPNNNLPPQPVPQPGSQPQQPVAAAVTQLPPVAAPAQAYPAVSQPAKSKKKLFIVIGAVLGGLVIAGGLVLVMALPAVQSAGFATSFMNNVTAGDVDAALAQTGDAESKEFLTSATKSLKGAKASITDRKYVKDGTSHYLFSVSGVKSKYARVDVIWESGKRIVSGFVYSEKELALVPSAKEDADTTATASEEPSTTTAPATSTQSSSNLACLVNDDYRYMEYDKSLPTVTFDTTYDPAKFTFNKTDSMFFKPDTTTETSFMAVYDDWADFASKNSAKQWTFRLEGSIYGTDPAGVTLANQRADKVKGELTKRGVPESRIIVDPAHDYSKESQEPASADIYRRVQVTIDPTCDNPAPSAAR